MTCVPYNIIKEGDLRNLPSTEFVPLEFDAINALYDGDPSTPAVTISGSPQKIGLLVEFGESYDVCYLDYFTSETNIGNIDVNYAPTTNSGILEPASLTQEATGHFRATINSHVYFIELRHDITSLPTDVNQLEVVATRNETLGFGTTASGSFDYKEIPHATVGTLSASATEIKVFNSNHFDDVARVTIAPTLGPVDKYLHLATSSSGVFYGIDGHGFSQPGPNKISLVNDPMDSALAIHPQWERRVPAQGHLVSPTTDGIVFDLQLNSFPTGTPSAETTGIISKEFFTATSFTAEVEIRFVSVRSLTAQNTLSRDFFFVLANGYPLPDVGYKDNFQSDGRLGTSTAGIALRPLGINVLPTVDTLSFMFRFVDGWDTENPFSNSIEVHFTGQDLGEVGGTAGPFGEQGNISMSSFDSIINEGDSLGDLTSGAPWHTWRISYDHVRRELSGWVDNIFMGSRVFREDPFQEACKLFIGFHGIGDVRWMLRNFRIWPDRIYRQRNVALDVNGGTASATVSGLSDNVSKINDGDDSSVYIGPEPTSSSKVRIDLSGEYDITYYTIRQKDQNEGTSAFGQTYFPDVVRQATVDFGGKSFTVHSYPNSGNTVFRAPTFSGTAAVCSGIDYLEWQFLDYDETTQPFGALAIEEIQVFAEEWVDVDTISDQDENSFPWVSGRWKNIKQYGKNALALRWIESPEAMYWPVPEYFFTFVNYGFSSAVNGRQFSLVQDYHHSESLFAAPGQTGAGDYTQWHSAVQPSPVPFHIWRYFEEDSEIAAVVFNSDTLRPSNVADEFKIQYLRDEGNPNEDGDWFNVPPVSIPYTNTFNEADILYGRYHDYLINNNDGEYYTNYFSIPNDTEGSSAGFSIGAPASQAPVISDSPLPSSLGYSFTVFRNLSTVNGLRAYIRFDEPIKTRGIRLVVKNPTLESGKEDGGFLSTPGEIRNDFALEDFKAFRPHGAGVYTSPVFDTNTRLNTERIKAGLTIPPGTDAAVFVRSSNDPPLYKYDIEYETWRDRGRLGNNDFPLSDSNVVAEHARAVSVGNKIYYIFVNTPRVYDFVLDTWSIENGNYPASVTEGETNFIDDGAASTSSPNVLPDDRVENNAAYLNGVIFVAAYNTGTARVPRIIKLDLENNPVWREVAEQRPPETEFSTMAGLDNKLYFFNRDGPVFYYDVITANWIRLSNNLPTHGGSRTGLCSAIYKGKVYVFGGSPAGTFNVDVFDPIHETFSSGSLSPAYLDDHQAVAVEAADCIYLLSTGASSTATLKYFPEEDRWQYTESLMWDRDRGGTGSSGAFYYLHDDYIYKIITTDDVSRTLVGREGWSAGHYPDLRDPVWGAASAVRHLPWKKLGTFGELLPQEQYFQFKVELYSYDRLNSPTLEDVRVVTPQSLEVPASGTASVYLKVGVSEDETFHALYTGDPRSVAPLSLTDGVYNILSTTSADGIDWKYPTTASGAYVSGNNEIGVSAPWVIKNSLTDYDIWFVHRNEGLLSTTHSIKHVNIGDLYSFSGSAVTDQFSQGVVADASSSVDWPCVVKVSPSEYHMWYTGNSSGTLRIIHADSTDGLSWSGHQKVIDIGEDNVFSLDDVAVFRPSVLLDEGVFKVWYSATSSDGYTRVLYRQSLDGISWGPISVAIDVGSAGTLDEEGASKPYVFLDSGTYYMYYFGTFGGVEQCIRVTSPDGIVWGGFQAAFPPAGLQGTLDGDAIRDVFVIKSGDEIVPGQVITTGLLKLHNEGASI